MSWLIIIPAILFYILIGIILVISVTSFIFHIITIVRKYYIITTLPTHAISKRKNKLVPINYDHKTQQIWADGAEGRVSVERFDEYFTKMTDEQKAEAL